MVGKEVACNEVTVPLVCFKWHVSSVSLKQHCLQLQVFWMQQKMVPYSERTNGE